jgi:hypothetical protein
MVSQFSNKYWLQIDLQPLIYLDNKSTSHFMRSPLIEPDKTRKESNLKKKKKRKTLKDINVKVL